jgi:DNA-binding IclR family transcriptional regulator
LRWKCRVAMDGSGVLPQNSRGKVSCPAMRKRKPHAHPAARGVATADRILKILSAYRRGDAPLELAELTRRTGLIKSTVLRLTSSLERYGFVVRLANGRYQLGPELFRLNAIYQESLDLQAHVLPILAQLADKTQETAAFFVRDGAGLLCLFRVASAQPLRVDVQPGEHRPLDQSAAAQVLKAFEKVSAGASVPLTLPTYSVAASDPHIASMAVPVIGVAPAVIGVIGIHGPTARLTLDRARELSAALVNAGSRLTKTLGGGFPYQ